MFRSAILLLVSVVLCHGEAVTVEVPFDGFLEVAVRSVDGTFAHRILTAAARPKGRHAIELSSGQPLPAGEYRWTTSAYRDPALTPEASRDLRAGDGGQPSSVAADEARIYLGWNLAREESSLVAVDLDGKVVWRWRHAQHPGVRSLCVDGEFLIVQTLPEKAGDPALLVRLVAASGAPRAFAGRDELALPVASLWPEDARVKPRFADAMAAHGGRLYLSFTEAGFVAVLDAATGTYVTTLTGPQVGPMALSTTPMLDPDGSGKEIVADFGVATIAQRAVSYFVMPRDPPWIAANTTHWLAEQDRILALTIQGDTMKTGDVTLFLGLGAPQHQVQARPAATPDGFTWTAGRAGGGDDSAVFDEIRALAFDVRGRLWVADRRRFSWWGTRDREGVLLGEFFGSIGAGRFVVP